MKELRFWLGDHKLGVLKTAVCLAFVELVLGFAGRYIPEGSFLYWVANVVFFGIAACLILIAVALLFAKTTPETRTAVTERGNHKRTF